MRLQKVTVGESVFDNLRASTWNAFIDAANHSHRHRDVAPGKQASPNPTPNCTVIVKNDSGADVPRFGVLGIDGPIFEPTGNAWGFTREPMLSGIEPAAGHRGAFLVAQEPIKDGMVGWAAIAGLTIARVDEVGSDFDRADVLAGDSEQLAITPNGTAQVLWTTSVDASLGLLATEGGDAIITEDGDHLRDHDNHRWALVRLGCPCDVSYVGKADYLISPDGTGEVSLWMSGSDTGENVTAHLDWMHGDVEVSAGKEVIVTWFVQEARWRITGAECED